ncbi:hypothetical protein BsWGS_28424 [Bradybaena similaris]
MAAASALLSLLSFCFVCVQVDSQYCRDGWLYFDDSCYGFGESRVTWGDAQTVCQVYKGKLAEIGTGEENEFLKTMARGKQAEYTFMGGTDIFSEGIWEWASTGYIIYPFMEWAQGEPNDAAGEDCLALSRDLSYRWSDYNCNNAANFICETKSKSTVGPDAD